MQNRWGNNCARQTVIIGFYYNMKGFSKTTIKELRNGVNVNSTQTLFKLTENPENNPTLAIYQHHFVSP